MILLAQLVHPAAIHLILHLPSSPLAPGLNENESVVAFRDWLINRAHAVPRVTGCQLAPRLLVWRDLSLAEVVAMTSRWKIFEWHKDIGNLGVLNQYGIVCAIQGRTATNLSDDSIITFHRSLF
jgi:hypothetical protein